MEILDILYFQLGLDDTNTNNFLTQVFSQSMMDYEDDKRLRTTYDEDLRRAIRKSLEESKALPTSQMNLPSISGLQNQTPSLTQNSNVRTIDQFNNNAMNVRVKGLKAVKKRSFQNAMGGVQSKKEATMTIQDDK